MKTKSTTLLHFTIWLLLLLIGSSRASAQDGSWSTAASFPSPRRAISGVSLNGIVYAMGGHDNGCGDYVTVDAYDPATNSWSTRAAMPAALNAPVAGAIDGKIYISTGGVSCGAASALTASYNPIADAWTVKSPNPEARGGAGGGVINGKLYVVGGDPGNGVTSRVDAYDPATDTWNARAPIPTPRSQFGSVVVNGILYAIAGGTTAEHAQDPGGLTKAVEAYDPVTDSWSSKAPLPEFVYWSPGMATELNGLIYVCGGARNIGSISYDGAVPSNHVFVYDPALDTWTSITPMPIAHAIGTSVGHFGKVYVFGGLNSFTPDTVTNEVDVLTPYAPLVQQPINQDGSSVFVANRGVVPIQFVLGNKQESTCDLPPATIGVTRTAGTNPGDVNESVYAMAADSGNNFRISGCKYIYNLNAAALGVGTYQVTINIGGHAAGSASFKLK